MDATVSFSLKSEVKSPVPPCTFAPTTHWKDAYDSHIKEEREKLWQTKSALDDYPYNVYLKARDTLFPLAKTGSQGAAFMNRAGHKLMETMDEARIWHRFIGFAPAKNGGKNPKIPTVAFSDICGGPGSFAQAIFQSIPDKNLRGFGMTLKDKHREAPEGWYPDLLERSNFTATFGVDGTGNIYSPGNTNAFFSLVKGQPMRLVVADGGFEVPFDKANYQEAISLRIAYSQWYVALRILAEGGSFVLKLFDTFTPFMRSMLFLTAQFFEDARVVKPKHSRVVNSERYLVGLGFKGISEEWKKYLTLAHMSAFTDDHSIRSLVPEEEMEKDRSFALTVQKMNETICSRQITALEKLLESSIMKEFKESQKGESGKEDDV